MVLFTNILKLWIPENYLTSIFLFFFIVDAVSTKLQKRSTKGVTAATRRQSKDKPASGPEYLPVVILPFILHLSFMAATAFLVMHVQVTISVLLLLFLFYCC